MAKPVEDSYKGRSPHGERGLKYFRLALWLGHQKSLPTRGAWIEMRKVDITPCKYIVAPHTGSVD